MQIATITSKRQLTIPSMLFKRAKLAIGEKVLVEERGGELHIKSAVRLVEDTVGSVKVPKEFRGLSEEEIIKRAKEGYFRKKPKK